MRFLEIVFEVPFPHTIGERIGKFRHWPRRKFGNERLISSRQIDFFAPHSAPRLFLTYARPTSKSYPSVGGQAKSKGPGPTIATSLPRPFVKVWYLFLDRGYCQTILVKSIPWLKR